MLQAFQDKAKHKGYDPKELTKVVEQKEKTFAKHWQKHLANQMTEIPDFNDVWRELGKHWVNREITRQINIYNLNVIIAIGYRVNSKLY